MRREFAQLLFEYAQLNEKIIVITCDLGMGLWDTFKDQLPGQFYNVGASEQAGMDIAVGLALAGKKPFIYSITNFLLYRPFETIRTYINEERIPVRLVASGRDTDYTHEGISHHSEDARGFLNHFIGIKKYWPEEENLSAIVRSMVAENRPSFISLRK